MKRYAFIALACGALAGCNSDQVVVQAPPQIRIQKLREIIPPSVLRCIKEPDGSRVKSIRASAKYIIDLRAAGRDCRQKLDLARRMIEGEK